MPVTYNSLRTVNGFRSPGFSVSGTGAIESSESLTVSGLVTIQGDISSTADIITSQSLIGNSLLLSAISIQNNVIQNTVLNQDLILSINGTGTIRLQEPVTITGLLTAASITGTNLQLSAVSIQNNVIQNTVLNQDLLLSTTGTGTIRLQKPVAITGVVSITDATDATSTTAASVVLSGGLASAKAVRTGLDSYFNSVRVGRGGNSATANNTAVGANTLAAVTSGTSNTAIGYNSLAVNVSGIANTALGALSLDSTQSGSNNTAVGNSSLTQNITGNNNTALGQNSLSGSVGNNNIALGNNAGYLLTSGNSNVIIGSATGSDISGTSNNIIMADGDGNVRFQINSAGQTAFNYNVTVNGTVSADPATASNHLVTNRQMIQAALAMSLFNSF